MTPRTRVTWQAAAAVWVVLIMAVLGGGRYPWWADASVYLATGTMTMYGVGQFIDWREARADRPHPADRPAPMTRAEVLREAADWAITGWPGPVHEVPRPTVAAVQQEALLRCGVEVTEQEAAQALAERLHFRGYGPPPPGDDPELEWL